MSNTELEETRHLLAQATFPAVISLLQQHEKALEMKLQQQSEQITSPGVEEEEKKMEEGNVEPVTKKSKSISSSSVELKKDVRVAAPVASGGRTVYMPITEFAWDQNGYDSPIVTVYVDLDQVGTVKDQVKCHFTASSFDLEVLGLNGKNYRLLKDNLEKDIIPEKSKFIVKKNKIVLKLQKVKGQYSYESWNNLTSKKAPEKRNQLNKDPSAGIMDMMKDMYDEGDDNMKRIIGEAMLKSKSGEKMDTPPLPPMDGM